MKQCWHKKYEKRPTFEEILKRLISIRPLVVAQADHVGRSPVDARKKRLSDASEGVRAPAADLGATEASESSPAYAREQLKISESEGNRDDEPQRYTTPTMPGT